MGLSIRGLRKEAATMSPKTLRRTLKTFQENKHMPHRDIVIEVLRIELAKRHEPEVVPGE
jgi:Fe2+ or Zn2+ uptake regulation protein